MANPHKWAKEAHYPVKRSLALAPDIAAGVQRVAEAAGWSESRALRECVAAGLPVVRERERSAKRRKGGAGGGK